MTGLRSERPTSNDWLADDDGEPYRYQKAKLPRGESHPIKRGELDALLGDLLDGMVSSVVFWRRSDTRQTPEEYFRSTGWPAHTSVNSVHGWMPLLHVRWIGENRAVEPYRGLGAHLWTYAVPASRRAELRALLLDVALPAAVAWIREVAEGPQTRRSEQAELLFCLDGGVLRRLEA